METLKFRSEKIVGRENELVQLRSALEELAQGKGRTIFVSGEAGIGKTRLMNETIHYLQSNGVNAQKDLSSKTRRVGVGVNGSRRGSTRKMSFIFVDENYPSPKGFSTRT